MRANQGEQDEALLDQMEADNDEFRTFVDLGVGIPEEWSNFTLEELMVNDGHELAWEYDSIMVTKG